ncbi:MAG: T9SS type A sorting domain-containing protein [Tannerella sp.]|jgi:hypothetical protein|nr:T9SS type A sorting domain-containing protein [Tannerella sp.]
MIKKFSYLMIQLSVYSACCLLCLLPSVPLHAQQVVLSAGGSLSQANATGTVSIGEVFTNVYLSPASNSPSLSFGVTRPATNGEMADANGNTPVNVEATIQASYDSPTQSVRIRFGASAGTPRTCRVYTLNGSLWRTFTPANTPESVISLNGLAQGVYLLHITAGNDSVTVKVTKQ